jgi:TctA family transporter
MAENGEAGRAIGAAEMSSAFGNITTAIVALLMIPAMLPIIMAITSADMVFIMLLGMAFVAVLSSGTAQRSTIWPSASPLSVRAPSCMVTV